MDCWRPNAGRWNALLPPMRPRAEDVAFARSIVRPSDRVVLLGVTPEYAKLGHSLLAVDSSPAMIREVWPGDHAHHCAVLSDWRDFDMSGADIILGDGVLTATDVPEEVIAAVDRGLRNGVREAALRVFIRPEQQIQASAVGSGSDGETRLRFLMMLAGFMEGRVRLADSERLHQALFQQALNSTWSGSQVVLSFPTWSDMQRMLPAGVQLVRDPTCDLVGWLRWSR
jgi:hypothetical protein